MNYSAPDLTQHPPRSPRTRLGGFVILARMLDKCRATIAGKGGEYHFDCPLDRKLFTFVGLDADAVRVAVATGKRDSEMLAWLHENARTQRTPDEIAAWSAVREQDKPLDMAQRAHFNKLQEALAPERKDLGTWYDLHDLDDYVTFGGRP